MTPGHGATISPDTRKALNDAPPSRGSGATGKLKHSLLDILACPIDKYYPLRLIVFEEKDESVEKDGRKVTWREIVHGVLICDKCGRWYPIEDEIPEMLPDDLREKERDIAFLKEWVERIPKETLETGKPFNLSQS